MKKSVVYTLLVITFILAVASIAPWIFIGYGIFKVADTTEKASSAIENVFDNPTEEQSHISNYANEIGYSDNSEDKQRCLITYSQILDRFVSNRQSEDYMDEQYFLFDITRDGMPELWLEVTDWEGQYFHLLYVYTVSDGQLELLYKGNAGHPAHHMFYKGDDYIILDYNHMGSIARFKYEYKDGKVVEKELFNGSDSDEPLQGYYELTEPRIITCDITDKELLQNI